MTMKLRSNYLRVQTPFESIFQGLSLEDLWSHPRLKLFKAKKDREIFTLELEGCTFFVKRYYGPGVGLAKYMLRGFRDRYGPENEWQKAHFLRKLGIRAVDPVAFGIERSYRIIRRAMVITLKLEGVRLEDLLRQEPSLDKKISLVEKLAAFAGHFHRTGLSHQDFYLCHLFWSPQSREICLIDLQRVRYHMGQNGQLRLNWIVKDLAQLDYSLRNVLTKDEYDRFKPIFMSIYRHYFPLIVEPRIINKIRKRVARISRHDQKLQSRTIGKIQ